MCTCVSSCFFLKAKSSAQRFKVTSQLRCLQYSDGATAAATAHADSEERVHICDAMQEGDKEERLVLYTGGLYTGGICHGTRAVGFLIDVVCKSIVGRQLLAMILQWSEKRWFQKQVFLHVPCSYSMLYICMTVIYGD